MQENRLIMVYYISTVGVDDIDEFFRKLQKKIATQSVSEDSEIIFIPVLSETRIECINPKYITDSDLIKKHERLMSELHEHLNNQINQIKNKDEK